jgi:two-component system, NarL family, response regulator LiaR
MRTLHVFVIDHHTISRQGLRAMLGGLPGIALAGEARTVREAVPLITSMQPDVVLLNLMLPTPAGASAIASLKRSHPVRPVIVLASVAEPDVLRAAVQAGTDCYVLLDVEIADLAAAIRAAHAGQPYLQQAVAQELVRLTVQSEPRPQQPSAALTKREREVLRLLARGCTNRQIATTLATAEKTISVHVSHVLRKLDVLSRTQAALYAARMGLL